MTGEIAIEIDDNGVGSIWIENPSHRNAMNNALIEALIEAFEKLSADSYCRLIVLRGRGGIFCAGRELRDLRDLHESTLEVIEAAYRRLRQLNEAIYYCPKPTVCVIEKYAFGLGATIVSWCDMALAEADALISYPEVHHGITPAPAVMAMLRGLGRKATMDLLLTGRRVGMAEAVELGLVTKSVPKEALDDALSEIVTSLLRGSPSAIRRTKEFIWQSEDAAHRSGMASAVDSISAGLASPEAREGIGAFLEKRSPAWAR
ncbi:MAG TPA: enoyl-CoA hydratase-related protein [Burkholderiaceae bacterium]|nr:enoyl-CoA hydratase-related protein [Burkholderiaceae bacterium]